MHKVKEANMKKHTDKMGDKKKNNLKLCFTLNVPL